MQNRLDNLRDSLVEKDLVVVGQGLAPERQGQGGTVGESLGGFHLFKGRQHAVENDIAVIAQNRQNGAGWIRLRINRVVVRHQGHIKMIEL